MRAELHMKQVAAANILPRKARETPRVPRQTAPSPRWNHNPPPATGRRVPTRRLDKTPSLPFQTDARATRYPLPPGNLDGNRRVATPRQNEESQRDAEAAAQHSSYPVVIITCVHYLGSPRPSPSQILGTFSRNLQGPSPSQIRTHG